MPVGLESSDRRFLTLCAAVFVALTIAALLAGAPSAGHSPAYASSYSTANQGGKAAYVLLGELGYRVERWSKPPSSLPAGRTATLVLADPFLPASAEERSTLRSFVGHGGRVLMTGEAGAKLLGSSGMKPKPAIAQEWQRFSAEAPSPITRGAPEIAMRAQVRWETTPPEQLRAYGDADGATVIIAPLGEGEVIWWADATPLANNGLTQASNLLLFLNSVGPVRTAAHGRKMAGNEEDTEPAWGREPRRVLWDEYFHGEREGFWSYVGRTPVPWFLLQAAFALVAALVTYGRRLGPSLPIPRGSRLSPLEFVETLGDLYQRQGAAAGILEVAYRRFRTLLLRRLDLPLAATPEEVYHGVRERLDWSVPGFRETLLQCERGVRDPKLGDHQSLRLIQELHDYSRRFGLEH